MNIEGEMRVANVTDLELVNRWVMEFARESLPAREQGTEEKMRIFAERNILNEAVHLWCLNGILKSMAVVNRPTKNGASISAVYTPREARKKGYASALVAHLSQKTLDSGKKFCVLYADLANPTSNKIYQKIGYREEADSKHFLFI